MSSMMIQEEKMCLASGRVLQYCEKIAQSIAATSKVQHPK